MSTNPLPDSKKNTPEFLQGGGEMGQRIREFNWSNTSLGPVETWPHSLRTCIRIMLDSRQPIWIGWGKDLIKFYNDPYKTIVGGKHPWALGKPASEVWKDIWTDIEPMLNQVMHDGKGTYVESQLLIMERYGYPEETYYTFSYTPIPDDEGRTAGMFCANTDDTDRITSERQLRTLTQLGKTLTDSKTGAEIVEKTISTLQGNPYDFPFALFREIRNHKAILKGNTDFGVARNLLPEELDLQSDSPLATAVNKALDTGLPYIFDTLKTHVGSLPPGAWNVSPDKAIVLPIILTGKEDAFGVLVVGINPFKLADEKYISFFTLVADLIATSFADVFAFEEERKRAEALAEIDKAKTAFFTNISHEFRTPLTLMLGSLEEIMENKKEVDQTAAIESTHRNALRLLRLVNNLLDFSRIEAGKVKAIFSPTAISVFTTELASHFEQLIQNAGLDFQIKIEKISQPVYVDKEMWEKIVLNLLSNAFKFTMKGSISILLHADDNMVTMEVRDTGLGIPDEELPKMFQRFHRVHNSSGRTYEGTGIGLSLVSELINLHGGEISVSSKLGVGTSFIVTIPFGKEHLPSSQIAESGADYSSILADVFIDEAENLFNTETSDSQMPERKINPALPFLLIVDDNADMRRHLTSLLNSEYNIITANDGAEALSKIKTQPFSLILSDIMMPVMDGTELVKAVKDNEVTANTPIILLSARAGEEAKIEGYNTGADDYLVKPFSARELKVRVRSQINLASKRLTALKKIEESEAYFRRLADSAPVTIWITEEDGYCSYLSKSWYETTGQAKEEALGFGWLQATHPEDIERTSAIFADANTRHTFFHALYRLRQKDGTYRWSIDRGMPRFDDNGKYLGFIGAVVDVHEQRMAELALEESQEMQRLAVESAMIGTWGVDLKTAVVEMSDTTRNMFGFSMSTVALTDIINGIAKYDQEKTKRAIDAAIRHPDGMYHAEYDVVNAKDGAIRSIIANGKIFSDKNGVAEKFFGTCLDVTKQKRTNEYLEAEVKTRTAELFELNRVLQQSNHELQQFAHVASHDLKEPLRKIKTFADRLENDADNSLSEKSTVYLNKIHSASNRMFAMIEGVLNYSVINTSQQRIESVDLNEVIEGIRSDLEIPIAQKDAVINFESLPVIEGSNVLLYQLFYNLVYNALKFSRADVKPYISVSATMINIDEIPFSELTVSDNGIGFEQDYALRIFDSFTRLNPKDAFEGTGLGLALCKRIAERHNGSIEARGVPDQGASFIVRLPLKQREGRV